MSTRNKDTQPLPPRPWRSDPAHGVVDANGEPVGLYRKDICQKVVEIFNKEAKQGRGKR
jgi:hypothetical protein